MLGHPDDYAQHGTTTVLGHPESSSQSINVRFTARHESGKATHTSQYNNLEHNLLLGYPDYRNSHTGAFTSPTIDMRLGKVDATIKDSNDVNKR